MLDDSDYEEEQPFVPFKLSRTFFDYALFGNFPEEPPRVFPGLCKRRSEPSLTPYDRAFLAALNISPEEVS
jgi:hypothetical protein